VAVRPESLIQPLPIQPEPEGRRVVAGDGNGYHVVTLGGPTSTSTGTGADVAAVFLHGGGPGCTGWSDFGPVAPLFANDRPVHLVDLLQYGRSDKHPIDGPRWSYLAGSMVSLLDSLDLERVDLICNSWGGTIAIALAAEYPERVRSMVITGSMPVFYGPLAPLPERGTRGRRARNAYFGGDGPSLEKMHRLMADLEWYDESKIPPETVEYRYRQSLDPDEMRLAASSDDLRGEWQDLEGHLRRIECPTLFAWGMYDDFLTPDYPLMLARMVPKGQLYVMDRTSHHLQEERPWDYYTMVTGFLEQRHEH
jgi:2-hydroxy-6-oxonona-2,4-dienedioate hydrolase